MDDLLIAQKYIAKAAMAKQAGHDFTMSFTSYKNIMRAKRCAYTGITMTAKRAGKSIRETDMTLDRVDNKLGYVSGNVVAACHGANQLKSLMEAPTSIISRETVLSIIKNMDRLSKRQL